MRFRTREGKKQDWKMLVTDVKKALKSVATTCDGDGGGECHVLFTHQGSYSVGKTGVVKGAGELTDFVRTGNAYGMEAWACVDAVDKVSEGFVRLVAAPQAVIP